MGEVQSVVLATDELESQEVSHAYASFRTLCQSSFRRNEKNSNFIISKLIKTSNCALTSWWRNAAGSCGMKLVLKQRSIIHIQNFWQFRPNFQRNDENRRYGYSIILYKHRTVDWDLEGRNPDSCCFERNQVWITRRIILIPSNWLVWRINFPLKESVCIIWH